MQIKNMDGSVIFSDDSSTLKQTVENAVKTKVSLSKADLRWADLSKADLRWADLRWADLSKADLSLANLYKADLRGANLSKADLRGADLYGANLYEADLSLANLSKADLRGANLSKADLRGADLYGANLYEADLRGANLYEADLSLANLYEADLYKADLRGADLYGANLYEADLRGASLYEADLSLANLTGTCLDPTAQLPSLDLEDDANAFAANVKATENDPEFLYGWRTAKSAHCTTNGVYVTYEPGCEYKAPWFSVSDTECHPGLYFAPSVKWLEENGYSGPFVMVKALKTETFKAGEKYRCKRFWVL